ncbi:MAG: DUF4185 domain-containing protein [Phaeodactylibacter sp.]|nr:DUF4185 domain-containing protein [Phaeodactylibacter sp.]MCB9051312.1 DUF4185 domain-containing protein [Lewinellaceae bacterium]
MDIHQLFRGITTFLFLFLLPLGCTQPGVLQSTPQDNQSRANSMSTYAADWNELFFRQSGWFGGDGIFGIPLDGKEYVPAGPQTKTLFIFSDSVIGKTKDGKVKKGDFKMIHNLVALLEGPHPKEESFQFYWPTDEEGAPTSLFVPQTPNTRPGEYYWLGDGFVNTDADSTLYIFAYRVQDVPTGSFFEFEQTGVSIIAIPPGSEPPFREQRQMDTPLFVSLPDGSAKLTFGSGIFVNTASAGAPDPDGYIYAYGVAGLGLSLYVARTLPASFEEFESWEFWNGEGWVADEKQVKPVTNSVSHELSLSPLPDGRYILAHQRYGMMPEVAVQVAKSPVGPFFPIKEAWSCPEVNEDLDYFVYNAKAYPHLSAPGELLVSYNVNSFDFFVDILNDAQFCRPRFIRLKL